MVWGPRCSQSNLWPPGTMLQAAMSRKTPNSKLQNPNTRTALPGSLEPTLDLLTALGIWSFVTFGPYENSAKSQAQTQLVRRTDGTPPPEEQKNQGALQVVFRLACGVRLQGQFTAHSNHRYVNSRVPSFAASKGRTLDAFK